MEGTRKLQYKGVVVVILATAFLFMFCQFLLITAHPTIMREFNLNATQVQWLMTAFLLTTIIFIPLTGYLSNTFSARSLVLFSLTCLFIGNIIGGFAPNFLTLVGSRIVQAIGAGVILPLVQTILIIVFPYERRGFAMGLLGAVVNVAPASAPSIAGMIIDYLDWRSLHFIMLPFILIATVFAIFFMTDVLEKQQTKLDVKSIIFSAIGFSLFLYGFSNISVYGFLHGVVIAPILIGIITLIIFIRRQFQLTSPTLNLKLFRNITFSLIMMLVFINLMLILSAETILPMFAQDVLGTTAFLSGFVLVPGTILLSIVQIISGNLYDRYGAKKISIIGYSGIALSFILLNTIQMTSSPYWIMVYFCIFMLGYGLNQMPLVTLSMNVIDEKDIAHGSAIVNTVRQFGMAFGIIFLSTIISVTTTVSDASYEVSTYWGTTYAFVVMTVFALIGVVLTFFIREERG